LRAALRRVWADHPASIGPVPQKDAFLEERLGDLDQNPGQDAVGIFRVALGAADPRVSLNRECSSRELKKPLPDASLQAQIVAPGLFLELMVAGSEAQSAAHLAKAQAR
jgi:hypothetical protein